MDLEKIKKNIDDYSLQCECRADYVLDEIYCKGEGFKVTDKETALYAYNKLDELKDYIDQLASDLLFDIEHDLED